MTPLGTLINTALFGKKVGVDEFGNRYYKSFFFSSQIGRYGKERRWVIYAGRPEASKIPPLWHGWIHFSVDNVPTESGKKEHGWERPHLPNLTGTDHPYLPAGHIKKAGEREGATGDYEAWKP